MITVLDATRLAKVSTATVSRVINTPDSVHEKTRKNVLLAMERCNCKYNALAQIGVDGIFTDYYLESAGSFDFLLLKRYIRLV